MNEIEAAIGIEQVKRLDGFLAARAANFSILSKRLTESPHLEMFEAAQPGQNSHYCLSILLDPGIARLRFEIVSRLNAKGIGTSIYYPRPVPHMTYYRQRYGFSLDSYPVAARISENSIALPVGPHLAVEDMHYIADGVLETLGEFTK